MTDRKAPLELSQVLLEELESQIGASIPPLPAAPFEDRPRRSVQTPEAAIREEKDAAEREENRRRRYAIALIHRLAPDRAALCLSGGGIRSASFSLGVLQALAGHGLLKQFDFLSTVSGGGYIGGWLSAWVAQSRGNVAKVEAALVAPPAQPLEPEPAPIRHLRTFSNYLAPQLGLFSADTWTLIATVLRNLLLNWLVLLSLLLAAMAAPFFTPWAINAQPGSLGQWTLISGAFALLSLALAYPPADLPVLGNLRGRQSRFLLLFLLPLTLGILLLCAWWAGFRNTAYPRVYGWDGTWQLPLRGPFFFSGLWSGAARASMLFFSGVCLCGMLLSSLAFLVWGKKEQSKDRPRVFRNLVSNGLLTVAMGAIGGWVIALLADRVFPDPAASVLSYALLAPPLLLGCFFLLTTLFIGLSSFSLQDEDREWWGRAMGWIGIAAVAWIVPHALMLHATSQFAMHGQTWWDATLAASGGAVGLAAAFYGFSARSAAKKETATRNPIVVLLPAAVAVVFFLLLGCGVSWLIEKVAFASTIAPLVQTTPAGPVEIVTPAPGTTGLSGGATPGFVPATSAEAPTLTVIQDGRIFTTATATPAPRKNPLHFLYKAPGDDSLTRSRFLRMLALVVGAAAFGWAMGLFINVNKFSLHTMYRNRLIRAFLGASRPRVLVADSEENVAADGSPPPNIREPHPFTGFDENDNVNMSALSKRKLFHVVNMALNIVHGEELAWQERMASSFTASPLHCGNWRVGFRPSAEYGAAISLGTAVAISGAAANPNAGYHSSPVVTFLMTLFNLRLGWWLGNPGVEGSWRRAGPRHAAWPLLAEALGNTREKSAYINLSDGGHFENLGVYEMVLRRARRILAIDGGCDGDYTFEDLGNVIRKVRIDFGIEIKITLTRLIPVRDEKRRIAESSAGALLYCARGSICYREVDGADTPDGELIYIKPMMTSDAPADVANYHSAHPDFPHETTSDQFFSESQLESYRALGEHQLRKVVGDGGPNDGSIAAFFDRAKDYAAAADSSLATSTLPLVGPKSSN